MCKITEKTKKRRRIIKGGVYRGCTADRFLQRFFDHRGERFVGESADGLAVEIENAVNRPVFVKRYDRLRARIGIAGDMTGKFVNVVNDLSRLRLHRRAAYAFARHYFDTGGFSLKRSEHEYAVFNDLISRPAYFV